MLIKELLSAGACLYGAALAQDNAELRKRMRFTQSDLLRMPGAELLAFSKSIRLLTEDSDFSLYGFNSDDQLSLYEAIDAFEEWVNKPRNGIVSRVKSTHRLKALLSSLMEVIQFRLDRAMEKLSTLNPDLYLRYQSARVIVDLSTSGRKGVNINS